MNNDVRLSEHHRTVPNRILYDKTRNYRLTCAETCGFSFAPLWSPSKMAESPEKTKASNYKEALSLLTQAVGILENSNDEKKTAERDNSEGKSPLSNTYRSHGNSSGMTSSEISRLFLFFLSRSTSSSQSSGSTRFSRRPTPYFKPKETWTHTFICLSERDAFTNPSRGEKICLKETGLGERKIVFNDKKGNFAHFQGVLETQFPKLKTGRGFEILRSCGGRRQLEVVAMLAQGYNIPFLKQSLGQAIAYIWPLQRDLDMTPVPQTEVGFSGL